MSSHRMEVPETGRMQVYLPLTPSPSPGGRGARGEGKGTAAPCPYRRSDRCRHRMGTQGVGRLQSRCFIFQRLLPIDEGSCWIAAPVGAK
jgi:hypothetical protein